MIIAVVHQKGGSGKTTLAINLAAAAHLEGHRTLLVDMDRQASAFDWSATREEGSRLEGIAVVKADKPLPLPHIKQMAKPYDVIVLDGPPRLGDVTQSAAVAADVALLPIQPGPFDFWAMAETLECLEQADLIREQLRRGPLRKAFVINRAVTGTILERKADDVLREHGGLMLGVVHQRVGFPEAALRGESVFTYPAAHEAAAEIERLWRALKGAHGPKPQKALKGTKRTTGQSRGREARIG